MHAPGEGQLAAGSLSRAQSGLPNVEFVERPYDPGLLPVLEQLIQHRSPHQDHGVLTRSSADLATLPGLA